MTEPPDETPIFFDGGSCALFGVLHRPATAAEAKPAFVFCHPLAEEKLWSHRVFVSYARRLAAAGHPVLRFDFMGNGDSAGEFSELSVATFCADLRCAIAEARRLTGTTAVSLLGLRLGGTIASLVAEEEPHISQLILWAPITDGERYMQELLRVNLMMQMAAYKSVTQDRQELIADMQQGRTVNIDGYEMGWPLYSSVAAIKAGLTPHVFAGQCLVVDVDRQPRPITDFQRLAASYSMGAAEFAQEEPFWKELLTFYQEAPTLFDVTSQWLGAHAASADRAFN